MCAGIPTGQLAGLALLTGQIMQSGKLISIDRARQYLLWHKADLVGVDLMSCFFGSEATPASTFELL
jgi:hypothetical protein